MRGGDQDCEDGVPENVLPEVAAGLEPEAAVLAWRGRGNIIAAGEVAVIDMLERA